MPACRCVVGGEGLRCVTGVTGGRCAPAGAGCTAWAGTVVDVDVVEVNAAQEAGSGRGSVVALPVPGGLAADLVESLDHPMMASEHTLRDLVPDPPGGLTTIGDAIAASLGARTPRPVNALADPHHLADTDPPWAGGDVLALRRLARALTPRPVRPALELVNLVPGPVAGVLRTGLDILSELVPNGKST